MNKYKLVWLDIDKVKPYENNPRVNLGAIEPVAKSLELYNWTKPIAVDKNYVIVCGHTRLLAAKQLGRDKVLCMVVTDLTPEQIKAYRLADNKLAEIATWNYAELIPELEYLQSTGIDISLLGLDIIDTSEVELAVKDGEIEDDKVPSVEDEVTDSTQGSIYKLGDHILVCGDNQTEECYRFLMGEDKAQLAICDTVKEFYDDRFIIHAQNSLAILKKYCKTCSNLYYFFNDKTNLSANLACMQNGITIKSILYWIKNRIGKDGLDYHNQYDSIIFADLYEITKTNNLDNTNIFKCKKPKVEKKCKDAKPVELINSFLEISTKRGDIVLDNWGGTGTTLIACEKMGRRCRMIENSEDCCDIIRKRYAEFQFGEGCDWVELTPKIGEIEYE